MGLFDWLGQFGKQQQTAMAAAHAVDGSRVAENVIKHVAPPQAADLAAGRPYRHDVDLKTCPAHAPSWLQWAWKEIGQRELPENRGPVVERYARLARAGRAGEPWCAMFANAALESAGLHGTRSASSQSFRNSLYFDRLKGPALGAIVVYWRGSHVSGLGHVGFYVGERDNFIWTLGGNEGNEVAIEPMPRVGHAFGLEGYYWPHNYPAPQCESVLLSSSVPRRVASVL